MSGTGIFLLGPLAGTKRHIQADQETVPAPLHRKASDVNMSDVPSSGAISPVRADGSRIWQGTYMVDIQVCPLCKHFTTGARQLHTFKSEVNRTRLQTTLWRLISLARETPRGAVSRSSPTSVSKTLSGTSRAIRDSARRDEAGLSEGKWDVTE